MAKGVMIMPESMEETIKAKHWLMSRDLDFKEVYIDMTNGASQLVILTNFDLVDKILYILSFGAKKETIGVY